MLEAFWLGSNWLVGVPVAAAIVVALRELARAMLAGALGSSR